MQNKSHAVMAQRSEAADSLDDFPTPPWATRALLEHVLHSSELSELTCLEPACGVGHMSKVLKEYFGEVQSSDIHDYGYGAIRDYLKHPYKIDCCDWMITNPPFRLAEDFILKSLRLAREGVAILARTVFLESVGRHERIFSRNPPTIVAQFTERVPMLKGRLDKSASTATGYCWLVWKRKKRKTEPRLVWIPPCRKALEREGDYDRPSLTTVTCETRKFEPNNRQIQLVRIATTQDDLFGT
jgi:hypothetical protein